VRISAGGYIVTRTEYNDAGQVQSTFDAMNRETRAIYDDDGRAIKTIQNYADGIVSETDTACDLTTEYQYDSKGRLATMTAVNAKGDDGNPNTVNIDHQTTKYLYTSVINASWQTAVVYPDSTDSLSQDPATKIWTVNSGADHVSTTYDLMGRVTGTTDQRGVVHQYTFDSASRLSDNCPRNPYKLCPTIVGHGKVAASPTSSGQRV
jgi:YD repeat-containing protein